MSCTARRAEACFTGRLLGHAVLIDDDTTAANKEVLGQAETDLEYDGIAINEMPPTVWLNPLLTWGGNGHPSWTSLARLMGRAVVDSVHPPLLTTYGPHSAAPDNNFPATER